MIPFIRRQKILDLLNEKDIVYIEDFVKATNVSDATVRRDMKTLYEEGYIDLLSGGAAKLRTQMGERPLPERVLINKEEKEILGKYAASLVNDGDFIFIGPGTTENTIIPHLEGKNITLVTNGAVGAGYGEIVLIVGGSSSRQTEKTNNKPVDATIMGIVDTINIHGNETYNKAAQK